MMWTFEPWVNFDFIALLSGFIEKRKWARTGLDSPEEVCLKVKEKGRMGSCVELFSKVFSLICQPQIYPLCGIYHYLCDQFTKLYLFATVLNYSSD